jgi:hypothetical protein
VISGQKTDLIADMSLLPSGIEKVNSSIQVILYPNPAENYVSARLPDILSGVVGIRIINQTGQTIIEYNTEISHGIPLMIDIKSLSAGIYNVIFSDSGKRHYHGRFVVFK